MERVNEANTGGVGLLMMVPPLQLLFTLPTVAVTAISPVPVAVRVFPEMLAKSAPEMTDQLTGCPAML